MIPLQCLRRVAGFALVLGLAPSVSAFVAAQTRPRSQVLEVGEVVPPLEGVDLDGKRITISYAENKLPTVVYVITPAGHFVVRNEANFATVIRGAAKRFNWVVLSTYQPNLHEYITQVRPQWKGVPVTVVSGITPELKAEMRLGAYPQTLVIGPDRKVIANFRGAYLPEGLTPPSVIEEFFQVKFAK